MIDKNKFKQSRTAEVTLSTGDVIQVREMSLSTLQRVAKLTPGTKDGLPDFKNMGVIEGIEAAKIIALDCATSKEFPLVDKPDRECSEEEIGIDLLPMEDLAAIFKGAVTLFTMNALAQAQKPPVN